MLGESLSGGALIGAITAYAGILTLAFEAKARQQPRHSSGARNAVVIATYTYVDGIGAAWISGNAISYAVDVAVAAGAAHQLGDLAAPGACAVAYSSQLVARIDRQRRIDRILRPGALGNDQGARRHRRRAARGVDPVRAHRLRRVPEGESPAPGAISPARSSRSAGCC